MDYQFITDPITGTAQAKFSLEHEAFGYWLTIEIGTEIDKLTQVLSAISDMGHNKQAEICITGCEYSVVIRQDEVLVEKNSRIADAGMMSERLSEEQLDFDQYDQASCGREDFREVLLSWAKFVK